ncbi:substrate-binding periplasmic protein [Aestuariispira insulae]|uniref:Amino acid ABC transporter substrate-binding protein (PAAT family) n=1 Tax=Aestuariispira insulae TaxID=1461337 RepID=A0A3D9HGE6_9PROT|nr:transporter substrate-binding domain-containing protein [Aestuariispira insulae]RED48558.1 amino acid ABC transporter substrate-binding protein (PAAT family) [Aestuariispira insulae]
MLDRYFVRFRLFPALFLIWFFPFAALGEGDALRVIPIVTEEYPPYEMSQPVNGLRGFDYEVLKEAFAQMGYRADVRFLPWRRALAYARKGDVAAILTCAHTEDREEFINFSDPISHFTSGFYMRADFQAERPTSLEDVSQVLVGSVGGYESFAELEAAGATPMVAPNTQSAVKMLQMARFNYLYLGRETTDFVIKQLGLEKAFRFQPIKTAPFYLCFSRKFRGSDKLRQEFNQALRLMRADGRYEAIHDKYR